MFKEIDDIKKILVEYGAKEMSSKRYGQREIN